VTRWIISKQKDEWRSWKNSSIKWMKTCFLKNRVMADTNLTLSSLRRVSPIFPILLRKCMPIYCSQQKHNMKNWGPMFCYFSFLLCANWENSGNVCQLDKTCSLEIIMNSNVCCTLPRIKGKIAWYVFCSFRDQDIHANFVFKRILLIHGEHIVLKITNNKSCSLFVLGRFMYNSPFEFFEILSL
jgi:hypothetical protein